MWSNVAYLLHSGIGQKVLKSFQKKKTTPGKVAKQLGISLQSSSKIVHKLRERKLINCLNPKDFNYRIYEVTPKGTKALKELESL